MTLDYYTSINDKIHINAKNILCIILANAMVAKKIYKEPKTYQSLRQQITLKLDFVDKKQTKTIMKFKNQTKTNTECSKCPILIHFHRCT